MRKYVKRRDIFGLIVREVSKADSFQDLMSPSNKYVRDDSFIVEVWFKEIDVVK